MRFRVVCSDVGSSDLHGESGKSMIGKPIVGIGPSQLEGQFQAPYGTYGPTTMFTIPALRYMKKYDIDVEKIANVAVVQREWAAKQSRASFRDPITVDDVLNSRMIAWPFRILIDRKSTRLNSSH